MTLPIPTIVFPSSPKDSQPTATRLIAGMDAMGTNCPTKAGWLKNFLQAHIEKMQSDSEDDGDYVPPAEDSSSDEGFGKGEETGPKEGKKEEKDLRKVWESFEATLTKGHVPILQATEAKLVKVRKRYRFAGEEHEEILEVPEDSEDAKRWTLYHPDPPPLQTEGASTSSTTTAVPGAPTSEPAPKRKPGPRKPKTTLRPIPSGSSKAKKITTLEKSAMDWKSHLSTQKDSTIQQELDANRRGGGYLEKVQFLQRVEERKEESYEAARSSKRQKL